MNKKLLLIIFLTKNYIDIKLDNHSKNNIICAAITTLCSFMHFKLLKCKNCFTKLQYGCFEVKVKLNCENSCSNLIYDLILFLNHFKEEYNLIIQTNLT